MYEKFLYKLKESNLNKKIYIQPPKLGAIIEHNKDKREDYYFGFMKFTDCLIMTPEAIEGLAKKRRLYKAERH